jgi:hypothetical protein
VKRYTIIHTLTSNVKNFVVDFEDVLSDEALRVHDMRTEFFRSSKHLKEKGQADQVVEFIKSDSPLAEGIEKTLRCFERNGETKIFTQRNCLFDEREGIQEFF